MKAPLIAPAEVADDEVGRDAALVERAQHPDLDRAEAGAAREHEGDVVSTVRSCPVSVAQRARSYLAAAR